MTNEKSEKPAAERTRRLHALRIARYSLSASSNRNGSAWAKVEREQAIEEVGFLAPEEKAQLVSILTELHQARQQGDVKVRGLSLLLGPLFLFGDLLAYTFSAPIGPSGWATIFLAQIAVTVGITQFKHPLVRGSLYGVVDVLEKIWEAREMDALHEYIGYFEYCQLMRRVEPIRPDLAERMASALELESAEDLPVDLDPLHIVERRRELYGILRLNPFMDHERTISALIEWADIGDASAIGTINKLAKMPFWFVQANVPLESMPENRDRIKQIQAAALDCLRTLSGKRRFQERTLMRPSSASEDKLLLRSVTVTDETLLRPVEEEAIAAPVESKVD